VVDKQVLRTLLVDDDPNMLRWLGEVLKREFPGELQIIATDNSITAIEQLESEVIDILITDLKMPGINGLELLRSAKQANAWTQVLIITGHSNIFALMDAMKLGANDYLLKPLDLDEFTDSMGNLLTRLRRWRRAFAGTVVPEYAYEPLAK
jgi:DNA-binding NtrC family response regulator